MSMALAEVAGGGDGRWRWRWPIDPGSYDTTLAVRAAEAAAIAGLGWITCAAWPVMTGPPQGGG